MSTKEVTDKIYEVGIKIDDVLESKRLELRLAEATAAGALCVINRLESEIKLLKDELVKAGAMGATTPAAAEMTYQYLQRLLLTARNEHSAAEKTSALKMGETAGLVAAIGIIKKTYDELSSQPAESQPPAMTEPPPALRNPPVTSSDDVNIQKKLDDVIPAHNKNKKVELSRAMRDARKSGKNKSMRQLLKEQGAEGTEPPDTELDVVRTTARSAPGT